jgi:regulator of protease activity HflC (stomatin/prohibitin superfamily)
MMDPAFFLVTVFVVVVLALAFKGFRIVQQSEVMVVERLGKYDRTLSSGVHVVWPLFDRARRVQWRYAVQAGKSGALMMVKDVERIDLRETVYDFPKQNVITADNVQIEINALLYFQITDPVKAVYEIANLPDAIEKLTLTSLRNVVGELELDKTLTSRDTINMKLRAILEDATNKWGVKVNRVELQDIQPPAEIRAAMEKQMRAERDRRASILEAEGEKASAILKAEGERESRIARAEGERQAQILRADGEAEARRKVAQAEAEAVAYVARATGASSSVNYLVALRYFQALEQVAARSGPGDKVVFLPFEATGALGALGGMRELLASAQSAPAVRPTGRVGDGY